MHVPFLLLWNGLPLMSVKPFLLDGYLLITPSEAARG